MAVDMEMLPSWVMSGKYTAIFLDWLLEDENSVREIGENVFVKVQQGIFAFVYLSYGSKHLQVGAGLSFTGMFCRKNYELYDVQENLRDALSIPARISFQSKEAISGILEEKITEKVWNLIDHHWDEMLGEKKYETRQLLPLLKREEVQKAAEQLYLDGMPIEDVVYRPYFSFGGMLSDSSYLMYLEHGSHAVNAMAKQWVRKHLPEISKQRIYYGCIREELHNIPMNGRLTKVRQIRESLAEVKDDEAVQVKINKKGRTLYVHMRAKNLTGQQGYYPLSCLSTRERVLYEKQYGRSGWLQAEDIQSVSLYRKTLYTVNKEAA